MIDDGIITVESVIESLKVNMRELDPEHARQLEAVVNEIKTGVAMAAYVRVFNQLGPNTEITRDNLQVWWTRMHYSMDITESLPDWALREVAEVSLVERWISPTVDLWNVLKRILERVRLER